MTLSSLHQRARTAFESTFNEPSDRLFFAPGRVNIIGEHTDYNDGFVMPCAINYGTSLALSPRDDQRVIVTASDFDGEVVEFDISASIPPAPNHHWSNYLRGVFQAFAERGAEIMGMNIAIAGNVPQGAGLSSSASLEVAVANAINEVFSVGLSPVEIALLAQHAENHYVGCNCGIMDQLISATGAAQSAQLIDCRSLEHKPVTLPEQLDVLVINSNVKRGLVDSEYNDRREQCEAVAKHFGVRALRDVSLAELNSAIGDLDDTLFRRARHVITENQRTLEAAQACANNDISTLSRLMRESHQSMRDDFEITVKEIDFIVDTIDAHIGSAGGVRMTGGGFGGCVVALVPSDAVAQITQLLDEQYPQLSGLVATSYLCSATDGAREIKA